MFKKLLICQLLVALVLVGFSGGAATAQSDQKPTVALLQFGVTMATPTRTAVLDMLHLYGYLSEEEHSEAVASQHDYEAERINLIIADAGYSFANLIPMIESALDQGADVLITQSTPATQAAVNVTNEMEDPTPVIFASVFNPYAAGIADAPCLKPAHVSGTQRITDYEELLALAMMQNPAMELVGTIYASASATGAHGAKMIAAAGEALGLAVEEAAVVGLSDVGLALDGLVSKGVDAIVLTVDTLTSQASPQIVSIGAENDIPVYHPNATYFLSGATVAAGTVAAYGPGLNAGHMLVGLLEGTIDLATTSINLVDSMAIAINLDQSASVGVEVPDELLARADFVMEDGNFRLMPKGMENTQFLGEIAMMAAAFPALVEGNDSVAPEMLTMLTKMAFPDPAAAHDAFLAGLHCTPEMIAEQQSELDADDG